MPKIITLNIGGDHQLARARFEAAVKAAVYDMAPAYREWLQHGAWDEPAPPRKTGRLR